MEIVKELPYFQIENVVGRTGIREATSAGAVKIGRQTYFIDFNLLRQRKGFNPRTVYLGIKELAAKIKVNGLEPLTVDPVKSDNSNEPFIAFIEKGHRRFMTLQILWKEGWLQEADMPGIKFGKVECYCNPVGTSELDRIKGLLSSNDGMPLTAYEISDTMVRLRDAYDLKPKAIAAMTGYSRQQVENMLILADEPTEIRKAVEEGLMKPTAAISLARINVDLEAKKDLIEKAKETHTVIKVADVEKLKPSPTAEPTKAEMVADMKEAIEQFKGAEVNGNGEMIVADFLQDGDEEDPEDLEDQIEPTTVKVLKADDSIEMQQANKSTRPATPRDRQEKDFNQIKDEEAWCSEIIQMQDKIETIAAKLPEQVSKDITQLTRACIQRAEAVREFVKKAEIRGKE